MKLNEIAATTRREKRDAKITAICTNHNIEPHEFTINEDGSIDISTHVRFWKRSFSKLPIKFNKVKGSFILSECSKLKSLENCPEEVTVNFYSNLCNELESTKGCPKKVAGDFTLTSTKITEFVDFPEYIGESIMLHNNAYVTKLPKMQDTVNGNFAINGMLKLASFENMPSTINGNVYLTNCVGVKSFDHLPKIINGELNFLFLDSFETRHIKNYLIFLKIKKLKSIKISFDGKGKMGEIEKILNKHIPTNDIVECQEELIEAGFGEYARLKQ